MSTKNNPQVQAASLRKRAEEIFREKSAGLPADPAMSPEAAMHELHVHQIELEMQNEELRRTQEELNASQSLYFDLYDLAPVGYITIGATGWILQANLTVTRLLGVSRVALLKQPISRFLLSEDQDIYYKFSKRLLESGNPQACELRLTKHDGTTVWTHLEATAARDEAGAPIQRMTLSDITGRRQREAYQEIEREVLQILNESENQRNFIELILAALKKRTGLDAAGIRLQDGEDFPYYVQEGFPKDFLLTENTLVERTADGGVCRDKDGGICLECTCGLVLSGKTDPSNPLFTKGGSCWTNEASTLLGIPPGEDPRHHPRNQCIHFGYASVALIPIRNRKRIVGLIQLNDRRKGRFTLETVELLEGIAAHIGEALMRKQAEEDLRKMNRHLEDAKVRAEDLALKAEASARAKNEFLAVMSHELRTPLNGVLGFAELLSFSELDDEQKDSVQMIANSGNHLLAVVNDILDFSSIEKGALAIQAAPLTIAELVKSAGRTVQKSTAGKGLAFRCEVAADVPEQILGDEHRIRQILINLLGNAVKFTTGGSVVLRVATSSAPPALAFSVEDTGIGIPPQTLALLFKPFSQADSSRSRAFEGTGLGLAISQRLAEAMDGSITVVSTPGRGSTFTFQFPLSLPPSKSGSGILPLCQDEPGGGTPLPLSHALVLVVEDDESNSKLIGKMLQSLGCRAEFAAHGAEAVQAFAPGKFSAILMDMAMPVMDGLEATAKIRELESGPRVPIIALTANVMPGDRERCLEAGMDDFLSKPFKRDELAAKLARHTLHPEKGGEHDRSAFGA